jgi:amino acid transporter
MQMHIQDNNLRLLLSGQEKEFIDRKISYHQRSLIYAALCITTYFVYLAITPLLHILFPLKTLWITGIAGIGFLIVFTICMMSIFSLTKLHKYLNYRKNYRQFMKRYNRIP